MTTAKIQIDPIFVTRFYIQQELEQKQEKGDWKELAHVWDKVYAIKDEELEITMQNYAQNHTERLQEDNIFVFEPKDFERIANQILDKLI